MSGCRQKVAEEKLKPVELFRPPSATEAFNLQTKCIALGEKLLEDKVVGSALVHEQISLYNPADNRCYVRVTVHTADLSTPREQYETDDYLYDGQTGDLLASRDYKGEQGDAHVFDDSIRKMVKDPITPSADEVGDIMDQFLNTDRRPTQH